MQTVSSYGVELRKQNIPVRQTLEIYRSAVCYLTEIYEQVWEELAEIPDAKRRFNAAEHLVHTTKKNPARFDFDLRFPKMPSYLRRAAIQHALGSVSSYETRMDLWEKSGEKAGKPRLAYENHAMPVFYRDVMYREEKEGKDEAGSSRISISAVPSDIRNSAVNTFRWNQQTSETSVIERVWGNPHQDKSHRRTGWQTTLLLNMGGSCPYLYPSI